MIEYKLRTNAKTRHVRLSVSRESGLEIVIPSGFDRSCIPGIIAKKELWIKRSIEKVQWIGSPVEIPRQIVLQCIGRSFNVIVDYNSPCKKRFVEDNEVLKLSVDPLEKQVVFALLKKWLREKSRVILLPWLKKISKEHGLIYNRGTIRSQRTRWGSCSVRKNINLNQALVFLRPELVEYLMLHELCHTVEMNHSKKFWELVGKHCPDFRDLDKELKNSRRIVERWMYC